MTGELTRNSITFLGLMSLAALINPASAKPLLSDSCVELLGEHEKLRKGGVESYMDHDPAKANELFKPADLVNIERYLFIEGQIRFRCPEIRLPGIDNPDLSKSKEVRNNVKNPKPPKKQAGPPVPLPRRKPAPPKKKAG